MGVFFKKSVADGFMGATVVKCLVLKENIMRVGYEYEGFDYGMRQKQLAAECSEIDYGATGAYNDESAESASSIHEPELLEAK